MLWLSTSCIDFYLSKIICMDARLWRRTKRERIHEKQNKSDWAAPENCADEKKCGNSKCNKEEENTQKKNNCKLSSYWNLVAIIDRFDRYTFCKEKDFREMNVGQGLAVWWINKLKSASSRHTELNEFRPNLFVLLCIECEIYQGGWVCVLLIVRQIIVLEILLMFQYDSRDELKNTQITQSDIKRCQLMSCQMLVNRCWINIPY